MAPINPGSIPLPSASILANSLAQPVPPQMIPGSPGAWRRLEDRLELVTSTIKVGGRVLLLPELAHPMDYIEQRLAQSRGDAADLPYWTRLWPGALVLASLVGSLDLPPGQPVLELGAGLGVPGLMAASQGHQVVLSDFDPDALEFARAAAEMNQLEHLVQVRHLDWTAPPADLGAFSTVLGAELLYRSQLFAPLLAVLLKVSQPSTRVLISQQECPFAKGFIEMASGPFMVKATSRSMRWDEEQKKVYLYYLRLQA